MTYASNTLDSTAKNPATPVAGQLEGGNPSGLGSTGRGLWFYTSTHTADEVSAAQFIADGYTRGMVNGDIMFGVTASLASTAASVYIGVLAVTTAGANISTHYILST